jgi:hypothetical protein
LAVFMLSFYEWYSNRLTALAIVHLSGLFNLL